MKADLHLILDTDDATKALDVLTDLIHDAGIGTVEGLSPVTSVQVALYEKCDHCHLFVEPNESSGDGIAEYVHLHRGNEVDTALDETHEAQPSGRFANLLTWRTYGPLAMRERFVS